MKRWIQFLLLLSAAILGFSPFLWANDKVTLADYSENPVYWEGFDAPTGIDIQFTIDIPFKDNFIIFHSPVLIKAPLPDDHDTDEYSKGKFARDHYRDEIQRGFLSNHHGMLRFPDILAGMSSLTSNNPYRGNRWPTWQETNQDGFKPYTSVGRLYHSFGREKIAAHYRFHPSFLSEYSEGYKKICLQHLFCEGDLTSCTKRFEQSLLIENGDHVSALFTYIRDGRRYLKDVLDLIPNPHGSGLTETPIDLSEELTQLLAQYSVLNQQPEYWNQIERQFLPSNLLKKGYATCASDPGHVGTLCFCAH